MAAELTPEALVGDMGFDDESVKTNDISFYRGETNVTDRVGIVSERVKRAYVHYVKGKGYILCRSQKGPKALCCKKLGPQKLRCAVVVVHYHTDQRGNIKKPLSYTVKAWLFGEDKYVLIREYNEALPIEENDLKLICKDATYQKINVSPVTGSFWKTEKLGWKDDILREAEEVEAKLPRLIGKLLDDEEILELVEEDGESEDDDEDSLGANVVGDDQDLDEVLGNM